MEKLKVLCVFGTRPEIIKLAPIVWAAKRRNDIDLVLAHTGQHYDYLMSDVFIRSLSLPEPNYHLKAGSGSFAEQFSRIVQGVSDVLERENPDVILVQGDTNTVPAVCLTARRFLIPVGHVEAGLRSFNERSPEEANRRVVATLALHHFAPTWLNFFFLASEGVPANRIHVVGNTIVDVVQRFKHRIGESNVMERFDLEGSRPFILLTAHRPENVDYRENLECLVEILSFLRDVTVVFPVHPRTRRRLEEFNLIRRLEELPKLRLVEPLPYFDFLRLLSEADLVLTDSGGVQEEAAILGRLTLTLRNTTPRWETVLAGINFLVGIRNPKLVAEASRFILSRKELRARATGASKLFGDGRAGERIAGLLLKLKAEGELEYPSPPMPEFPWRRFLHQS
ncbi:MAG: non-hydrolyzing UDP-N-acetylglucosamine 2-epimerase [Candidatus Hecatellaceae archaeon]